jgi:3-methyladenine DNA glycosylase AlkC
MPSEDSPPAQLKEWFDAARYQSLVGLLQRIEPRFDQKTFLKLTLTGLEDRSLMQRLHQCAVAADAALPGTFREKVAVLKALAPEVGHEFVCIFLSDYVATYGLEDFDFSLEALSYFTCFGSAEFAVRPFLMADQKRALAVMQHWAAHENEHVRRLASEGSRPRLPWGLRLTALVKDPRPTAAILQSLKLDPSLYVRRSVANHLNDITKDHAGYVLQMLSEWDMRNEGLRWIAKHACRTLIKKGDPAALALFGFGKSAAVDAVLTVSTKRIRLGERIQFEASIASTSKQVQQLAVDYVIHYVKAQGAVFEKVFKWTELELAAGEKLMLTKSQLMKDFSTRKHYAGRHCVELQINGKREARTEFVLTV